MVKTQRSTSQPLGPRRFVTP